MINEKDFEKEIAELSNIQGDLVPRDKYFEKIWDTIEYKSPVGQRYYLRFFFSVFFILFFIGFFFLYYSDFLSTVITLEKIQRENKKFIPVIKNKELAAFYKKDEIKSLKGLVIKSISNSKYEVSKTTDNSYKVDLLSGHIQLNNKEYGKENKTTIVCPDISIITNGICDIFYYDNIIRIIPIEGKTQYTFETKQKELKTGEYLFILDRKKIITHSPLIL